MKEKQLEKFKKQLCILSEIEKIREKMHNMINNDEVTMFDAETVVISQDLDKLIVEYLKSSGGKSSGEKVPESQQGK